MSDAADPHDGSTRLERCTVCRAPLPPAARFCSACGRPSLAHRRAVASRDRSERRSVSRAAMALAAAVLVTFAGLLVDLDTDAWGDLWQQIGVLGAAIVASAFVAGRAAGVAPAKPVRRVAPSYLAAVPTALASLATNFAYILGLLALLDGDAESPSVGPDAAPTPEPTGEPQSERSAAAAPSADSAAPPSRLPELLSSIVVAPLGEELLCRGVVMAALLRLGNRKTALLISSVLFAFLHGLGGGYVFELPHRFASGLLFGALRLWSGRLGPAMLAHALHNAACELLLAD